MVLKLGQTWVSWAGWVPGVGTSLHPAPSPEEREELGDSGFLSFCFAIRKVGDDPRAILSL